MKEDYIAIDLGAESGRVILGSLISTNDESQYLKLQEIHRFQTKGTYIFETYRWNLIRFWEEVKHGLTKLASLNNLNLQGIEVRGIAGKTQLEENLKTLKVTSGFSKVRTLGITRDADEDYTRAFRDVQRAIRNVGLVVPNEPLIFEGENPRVIVYILPRPNQNGALEDLCLEAVQGDP
ncbi:MAG: DUF3226 domain-containing protein, partial [Candidatus Hodarchaeota archaeon]